EESSQGLNQGKINFATILVLDDLITNGINSDFVSLSPVPIVNPDDTVAADAILEDFRRDFVDAQDQYPLKLSEGLSITWNLDHNADTQYGMSFHKEDRAKNMVFAGKLSLRFDPEYYSATPYPTYSKDSSATVICREFTSATERKNDYLLWVEVAFDKCMAATDYYASVRSQLKNQQEPLKERLANIYAGKEEVNEDIAQKLVTYYQAGGAFTADSVCMTGGREECLANLKTEIIRKYDDAKATDIDSLKVRTSEKPQPKKAEEAKPEGDAPKADVTVEKPAVEEKAAPDNKAAVPAATEEPKAAGTASEPVEKPAEAAPAQEDPADKPAAAPGGEAKPAS
ncbi:MAG: hypothetical protein GX776_04615, partial [Oxalobacter sp.]|nr:hypothetical protein [Oxalobacter sp.]